MPTQVVHQTKYDYAAIWLTFVAGATLEECAEMYGVPYGTLIQYSARHFWSQRRAKAKQTAFKTVNNNLAERIKVHRIKHQNFVLDTLDRTQDHVEQLEIGTTVQEFKEGKVSVDNLLNIIEKQDNIARKTLKLDDESKVNPLEAGFAMLVSMSKSLVNDNKVIEMEAITEKVGEVLAEEASDVGEENTSSAMTPFDDYINAITGQVGPNLGHSKVGVDEQMHSGNGSKPEETPEPGQSPETEATAEFKPIPETLVFKPIVNEN